MNYETKNLLNVLSSDHLMLHHSDMLISPTKGRPYGGRALFIRKNITVIKYEFVNKHVAFLLCSVNNRKFCNIYTYLPYDNNTHLNFSEFVSCLNIVLDLHE